MIKQPTKKGFTLLEMMIVALIIGILSMVALPSYRVAVAKARVSSVLPVMRKIREAQQVYYIEHRVPTCNLDKLGVEVDYVKSSQKLISDTYPKYCGFSQNDQGEVIHNGGDNDGQPFENQGEDDPYYNGVTKRMVGYEYRYVLPSKDSFTVGAYKLIYGDASNNVTIDYHLLGTTGEVDGQWAYTGCRSGYRRCDATCTARYEDSIWEKVCRALSNGKLTHENQDPGTAENGRPKGYRYCIGGGNNAQYECPHT